MLPMEEYQMRTQLDEIGQLHAEIATMGIALKNCEEELNRINVWLQERGYAPGRLTAEYTIQVLNGLSRNSNAAELDLLRRIVDDMAPVIQRKFEAGVCVHDILSHARFKAIRNMIEALRRIQALRPAKPIKTATDPATITALKFEYFGLREGNPTWGKGMKEFLMDRGVPYEQAQSEAGDF